MNLNPTLEKYLYATRMELSKIHITKSKQNLSQAERLALRNLQTNHEIIIKKADKSSTIVVQNRNNNLLFS